MRRCWSCPTCSPRCATWRSAARARSAAKVIGVTGSVGKTSTKEALRLALAADGETHASAASYNNHWGVPLSLARCPRSARSRVFEIGMNHAGEITPLTRLVRPACGDRHHGRAGASRNSSTRSTEIADAKAEIFLGLEPRRRRRHQPRQSAVRTACARRAHDAGVARIVSFGEHERGRRAADRMRAASRLLDRAGAHSRRRRHLQARRARAPPRAEFARRARGGRARRRRSRARRAGARGAASRRAGRGARITLEAAGRRGAADRRKLQRQSGLDAGGARAARRRPRSGRAAAASRCSATCWSSARTAPSCIASLREPVLAARRRSRLLLRPADARPVGGTSFRAPGRLCRDVRALEPQVLAADPRRAMP